MIQLFQVHWNRYLESSELSVVEHYVITVLQYIK